MVFPVMTNNQEFLTRKTIQKNFQHSVIIVAFVKAKMKTLDYMIVQKKKF